MPGDWEALSKLIYSMYSELEILERFDADNAYLISAYEFTERLWLKQFEKMPTVYCVILSEAPLFGSNKTYIYNSASAPTSFFFFNDLWAINSGFSSATGHFRSVLERKEYMMETMTKNGVLIMDIFPFAFNPQNTAIDYNSISKTQYFRLLKESFPYYLLPKLQMIRGKNRVNPTFVYRYKRLLEQTGCYIETELRQLTLLKPDAQLESINGTNMPLDRTRLARIYEQAKALAQ